MGVVIAGSHNEVAYNRFENYVAPSAEYGHDGGAIEINDRSLAKEDIHVHHNLSLRNQGFIEWVGKVRQDNFRIHHNVCMDYQSFLGFSGPCTNFKVEHNTVVCIIEAMKLMNEIQAETTGEVVKIYVENGQAVEYGQPLFGIKTQ